MISYEQQQADLLDQFRQNRAGNPAIDPPTELDSGTAAVAVMLQERLTPPAPSAKFVQDLEQRLEAESSPAANHRPANIVPQMSGESIPPTPHDDSRDDHVQEPRRPWFPEIMRIAAAGLAIALIGTLLILLFRDTDDVAAPGAGVTAPTSNEILVSWDPNGGEDYKLFIVDVTGEYEPSKVTPGPAEVDGVTEHLASWSPDGQRVVFVKRDQNHQSELVIINADGSGMTTLLQADAGTTLTLPVWSPDGSQIAYVGSEPMESLTNIYLINADGSGQRQLTDLPSGALYPSWSPDGSQIAFSATRHKLLDVWVVNADGSEPHPVAETDDVAGSPYWSPDGDYIAFGSEQQLWIVHPDGSGLHSVASDTGTVAFPGWSASLPGWSPDGQRIAYANGTITENDGEITIIGVDGKVQDRWASACETGAMPTWSPDGTRLAFFCGSGLDQDPNDPFANATWDLHIAGIDGANEQTLLTGSISWFWPPAWRPPVTGDEPLSASTPTPIPTPIGETATDRLYVVTSSGVTVTDAGSNHELYSIDAINPDAALSPDGSRLYVLGAGGDDQLVAFDSASGDEIWRTTVKYRMHYIPGTGPPILGVSPNGSYVYVHSYDNLGDYGDYGGDAAKIPTWVQVIDAGTGAFVLDTEKIPGYCHAEIYSSADSRLIFEVCTNTGVVRTFDAESGDLVDESDAAGRIVGSLQTPDSSQIYLVANTIRIFDTETGQIADRAAPDELSVTFGLSGLTTLSPNGTRLYVALGTQDNDRDAGTQDVREIVVLDTTSWEEVDRLTLDVPLEPVAFTVGSNGQYLYASERMWANPNGKVISIDTETGETKPVLARSSEIFRILTTRSGASSTSPPESILPPEPTVGEPIELPFNLAHKNSNGSLVTLVRTDDQPLMTQEEAMQALAGDVPWALGGEWDGKTVTVDGWYGIGTIGSDIEDNPMWLIDYGNVPGMVSSECPGCAPPPVYNHNVYAVSDQSGELLWWGSYDDGSFPDEPPAGWIKYDDIYQTGELGSSCWPAMSGESTQTVCDDPAGLPFPFGDIQVPQGATLLFGVQRIDVPINLRAEAYRLDTSATVEEQDSRLFLSYPADEQVPLPTSWSPDRLEIIADLPPGEYAIAVSISLPSDDHPPNNGASDTVAGSATYGFHIVILDEPLVPTATNAPAGSEIPSGN